MAIHRWNNQAHNNVIQTESTDMHPSTNSIKLARNKIKCKKFHYVYLRDKSTAKSIYCCHFLLKDKLNKQRNFNMLRKIHDDYCMKEYKLDD